MINYIVLSVSGIAVLLSIISVLTEGISANTPSGRKFRKLRINLRDFDLTELITSSLIMLFLGLVFGDENFFGIWLEIAMLFASWLILHGERVITLKHSLKYRHYAALKRRKYRR